MRLTHTRDARNNLTSARPVADNLVESWRRRGHDRISYEICQSHRSQLGEWIEEEIKGWANERERKRERKNGEKPEKSRGKCERAEGERMRKWKREKRAHHETGNELMKELV